MSVRSRTVTRITRLLASGLATLAAVIGLPLLSAGEAQASLSEFALSSSFGSFFSEAVGVDESTGDVYVYHYGTISKFDADGNPVDFSSTGTNEISAEGGGSNETEIAVDKSGGPADGDIYLAGSFAGTHIYGSDGKLLGLLSEAPGVPWGEVACGVAVDPGGRVYLGVYPEHVNEYVPTANPATNADYATSLTGVNEVCNVAVDPEGSVYVDTWSPGRNGPIVKYAVQAGGTKLVEADGGGSVAVANSPSAELFVGHHKEIQQFDTAGNLLSTFANEEGSDQYVGIAVNAKNGRLYASNSVSSKIEIWQGVIVPDVRTGGPTNPDPAGSVTLNGTVNPEEVSVESCSFEYGASVSYGSSVSCDQTMPLTGSGVLPVSATASGLTPNQPYHYRLSTTDSHGSVNGSDRTFTILVTPTVEDQPPSVSEIARASARLTGTINPKLAETSYHFDYGPTEEYGNTTSVGHAGSGASDTTVSQQLNELLPATTYHYRLVAHNLAGTTRGTDHTFTTGASTPPSVLTGGSSGIGQNTGTVAGTVDTRGLPTSYGFEIGTSTDYGPRTGLGAVGAGGSEVPVSLALAGLFPGTTYHYRITATNIDGTAYGADETFTTSVFANTFAEPPAPLPFVSVPAIAFPTEAKPAMKKHVRKKTRKVKKHRKKNAKAKNKKKK